MKKILLSTIACASMMLAANNEYKYELTPMFGTAFAEHNTDLPKGYSNAGLALGFNQTNTFFDQIELGFLRSIEDVNYQNVANRDTGISRIFTNIVKEYKLSSNYSLYALVGAGVEIFDDEFADNENGLFGNYGVGLKMKFFGDTSLKIDLRHLIETDNGDNTLLYNVGLAIPFGEISKPAPVVTKVEQPIVETPKDSDADGIIDINDKCPNTFKGAKVDMNGCELDDDKDGVVNRLDKCPNTIAGAKVDTNGCMVLVNLNINFDTNSAEIKPAYDSKLEAFANMMNTNTMLKATIEAHTDSVGNENYNQKLSEKRAASTVEALKALNVDTSRLKAIGYGETQPISSNDTAQGRAENRRVTAIINK